MARSATPGDRVGPPCDRAARSFIAEVLAHRQSHRAPLGGIVLFEGVQHEAVRDSLRSWRAGLPQPAPSVALVSCALGALAQGMTGSGRRKPASASTSAQETRSAIKRRAWSAHVRARFRMASAPDAFERALSLGGPWANTSVDPSHACSPILLAVGRLLVGILRQAACTISLWRSARLLSCTPWRAPPASQRCT